MIYGRFLVDSNLPYIQVGFVLDTGFSGDLKFDEQTAEALGIVATVPGLPFKNANGENVFAKTAYGFAELEGRRAPVKILIVDGMPLAGMGLFGLFGCRISIDCRNEEVRLERAV